MSDTIEVRVPDIGDFKDVPVVEVLVKAGQTIAKETPLVVLESDKASMEVPSTTAGAVHDVKVRVGDRVSKGALLLTLDASNVVPSNVIPSGDREASAVEAIDLVVPDIGDFKDVPVVEVLVKPGQRIAKEAPLVVLESEKASMEVPASTAGTIATVAVKPGDKVSIGTVIATLQVATEMSAAAAEQIPAAEPAPASPQPGSKASGIVHASPAIRRFARELGVELARLEGTGPRGRITRENVQAFVKSALQYGPAAPGGLAIGGGLPAWPNVDFAQFGTIERKPLGRIKKLSGPNLHRNWLQIPHITNYDEADVTELEAFRNAINAEHGKRGNGVKLTMLAFLVKASVAALQRFPEFKWDPLESTCRHASLSIL